MPLPHRVSDMCNKNSKLIQIAESIISHTKFSYAFYEFHRTFVRIAFCAARMRLFPHHRVFRKPWLDLFVKEKLK